MNTIDDLKAKVEILFENCKADAMRQIDLIQRAGADIVGDHFGEGETWRIPKDFMVAYAEQMKGIFARPQHMVTRRDAARIQNYYNMMGR